MPHSTLQRPGSGTGKTVEDRFQAGLQLQALYALPIYQLPAEIMLNIVNRLEMQDYPSLITATWHLLRHHGIAPVILTPRLKQVLVEPRCGFYGSVENATDKSREGDGYLPIDLRRLILHRLAPRHPFFSNFTNIGRRLRGGFENMPVEIHDMIFRRLDATTKINVTLACFRFSDRDIEWLTHEIV